MPFFYFCSSSPVTIRITCMVITSCNIIDGHSSIQWTIEKTKLPSVLCVEIALIRTILFSFCCRVTSVTGQKYCLLWFLAALGLNLRYHVRFGGCQNPNSKYCCLQLASQLLDAILARPSNPLSILPMLYLNLYKKFKNFI